MHKALPWTFAIPSDVGWNELYDDDSEEGEDPPWQDVKGLWHGFCVVLGELARCDRAVPELVCGEPVWDVNRKPAGIPWQFFQDENSEELCNFETICSRGLRRLDLAIRVTDFPRWNQVELTSLSSGRLRGILQKATSLESFSLDTNVDVYKPEPIDGSGDILSHGIRILDVLPLQSWPELRHLTLSKLHIDPQGFLDAFDQLPPTLKCLELVALELLPYKSWGSILEEYIEQRKLGEARLQTLDITIVTDD